MYIRIVSTSSTWGIPVRISVSLIIPDRNPTGTTSYSLRSRAFTALHEYLSGLSVAPRTSVFPILSDFFGLNIPKIRKF